MKLSKDTINQLKNFSEINSNILFKPGNVITTVSTGKNIMGEATITESLSVSEDGFGIYDLNEFLGVVSLFENPDLEFSNKFVQITEGKTSIKYFAADPSVLIYPNKAINFPEPDIEFSLDANTVTSIKKVSAVLKALDISIVGDGSEISIQVGDKRNATASSYSSVIGTTDKEFTVNLKVDNLKLVPEDYTVSISKKKISRFFNKDVTYYIAIEADSTFNF